MPTCPDQLPLSIAGGPSGLASPLDVGLTLPLGSRPQEFQARWHKGLFVQGSGGGERLPEHPACYSSTAQPLLQTTVQGALRLGIGAESRMGPGSFHVPRAGPAQAVTG